MKTFKAFNLIHIVSTLLLFGWTYYYNPVSFNDDPIFFALLTVLLLIIANCTGNIILVKKYTTAVPLTTGRKIFSWIFFILFLFVTGFYVYAGYINCSNIVAQYQQGRGVLSSFKLRTLFIMALACNGIYIIMYQCYFLLTVKKRTGKQQESLLNEIGQPENI